MKDRNHNKGIRVSSLAARAEQTETKRAEESLKLFRSLLDRSSDAIEVIDPDTLRFLDCNQSACQSLGYSREEFLALSVFDIDPKIDELSVAAVAAEMKRSGFAMFESIHRRKDGSTFPVEVNVKEIKLDRAYRLAVVRDITERKQAEEALRQAEQKYRNIFENAGEGIFQTTPEGQYIAANPALARMHGFDSPEDLIRRRDDISQQVYVDPARREEFKRLIEENGIVRGFEHQVFRKDGSKIWISENARAVRDEGGAIRYYEGAAQDINERKRADARSAAFATLARKLSGARTPLDAGKIIAQTAADLFGWDSLDLNLYDVDRDLVHPMLNIDMIDGQQTEVTGVISDRKPTARSHRVIAHGPELRLREEPVQFDGDTIPFGDKTRPSASIMTVPIRHAAQVIGLLSIQSYTVHGYDKATLDDLEALADHCGEALNRIRAEESLTESEERFRQMADHFEDVISMTDKDISKILYINPAYEKVFGRSCESLYERLTSFIEAVHPEDRASVERLLEGQRNGDHHAFEYRIVHSDGSVRWIQRRSFPIRNNEGEVYRIAVIGQDITERKRSEEALRESEERYRDLVENSREFICTHDLNGVILSANRAASEVLGYDLKDFCGKKNYRDLLVPEVRDQFDGYLARIRRDGVASGLNLVQTSSGERRILEYHNTLRTEGVATPIVRGMARDITEQRRAEKAMSDLRRELELTMNSMEEGVHRVNLKGEIVFENPAAARMLGWEIDQLLGKPAHLTMHHTRPDGTPYPTEECPIYATFRDGVSRHVADEVFWRQDGTSFPVEYMTAPMRNDRNEIIATVVTFRNITARKHAEEELRESEERYRELFENARDAIYVHDLSGRYTSVNRAAEQLSGFTREEIMGKHFSDFVSARDLEQVLCRKLDEENETVYEVELVTRSGQRVPVEISSRVIYENGVAVGVQGTARDITDRKRVQEALRIYSQRLIQAQEAEREKIARELHDEIGQVLTAVRINLQSMQRSSGLDENVPRLDESIGIVDEALGRVRELSIELRPSLLDDLGLTAALRWYVDRYAQRTGIIAEVLNGFKEDVRLPRELETACFRIAQEALNNVVRHAQAGSVSVQLERSRERMLLTIIDDGVGFDVDKLRKKAPAASTLGLRGMEERALAVGGHIEIDSGSGRGTRVRAIFPLKRR